MPAITSSVDERSASTEQGRHRSVSLPAAARSRADQSLSRMAPCALAPLLARRQGPVSLSRGSSASAGRIANEMGRGPTANRPIQRWHPGRGRPAVRQAAPPVGEPQAPFPSQVLTSIFFGWTSGASGSFTSRTPLR